MILVIWLLVLIAHRVCEQVLDVAFYLLLASM
jgi:hypothetical protein